MPVFSTRYRDEGDVTAEHLVVLIALLFFMMIVYGVVHRRRSLSMRNAIHKLYSNGKLLERNLMPRRQYVVLLKEFIRTARVQTSIGPQDPGKGDIGWGLEERVHFNTSIAKSFVVIDEAVTVTRPGLRSRSYRTIREYIIALRVEFPAISEETTLKYINWYEKAKFSDYKFTEGEYNEFMRTVLEILDSIQ